MKTLVRQLVYLKRTRILILTRNPVASNIISVQNIEKYMLIKLKKKRSEQKRQIVINKETCIFMFYKVLKCMCWLKKQHKDKFSI